MKTKVGNRNLGTQTFAVTLFAAALMLGISSFAQTDYSWALGDAGGNWDTTTANWNPGPIAWPNGTSPADNALFNTQVTTGRDIAIPNGTTINVNKIVFSNLRNQFSQDWNFTISGTLNLVGDAIIDPADGQSAVRINTAITGSNGLTLQSSGARNIAAETRLGSSPVNTYTGVTKIYNSTLAAYKNSALGATGEGNHTEIYTGRLLIAGSNGGSTPLTISEEVHLKTGAGNSALRSSNANNILTGNVVYGLDGNDASINVNTVNTFTVSGNITLADGMSGDRRISLRADGGAASKILISGTISDASDGKKMRLLIDGSATGANSGTVELSGDNSFSGSINLRRGTLLLSHENAEGNTSGVLFADGGLSDSTNTLRLLLNGPYTFNKGVGFYNAAGTNTYTAVVGGNTADNSTFSGNISFQDDNEGSTYQLTAAEGGTVTLSGLIDDNTRTRAIQKIGNGTVVLSRAAGNTYDGGTTVTAGTLSISNTSGSATGAGNVTVNSGATLAGSGIIGGPIVTINGNIAPNGTITFSNESPSLVFGAGSNVNFDLGTASDKIAFANLADSLSGSGNANLNLTLGDGFSYANTYTIFENTSTAGFTFNSITGYDTENYTANFAKDGNNYVLSFTPNTAPEINVLRGGNPIANGGTDTVSGTAANIGKSLTYTIQNTGDANLTLENAVKSNESNCGVVINTQPASPVAPSGSTNLVVTVTPVAAGAWSFDLSVANNDSDENPYQWTVSGNAIASYTLTYTAGANGSLTGNTNQLVAEGGKGTAVTAVPDDGYYFLKWSDNIASNPRTDVNVKSNINVTAIFAELSGKPAPWDFNGDGRSDVLAQATGDGYGWIYIMNGSTPFTFGKSYRSTNPAWKLMAISDFDGNGASDMLWQNDSTNQTIMYLMNGISISATKSLYNGSSGWKVDKVADFNGDSKADILWMHPVTGDGAIWLMNGFSIIGQGFIARTTQYVALDTGDYNNDGKADILWEVSGVTGKLYLMNGLTITDQGDIYERPAGVEITGFADFNGDGCTDILWRNPATNSGYMMLMNGLTIIGNGIPYANQNAAWGIVALGDFNGDGKADLLWQNSSTGTGVVWLMNGYTRIGQGTVYKMTMPTTWAIKKVLDFNGDGKADLLWQNATNKAINYIMNGNLAPTAGNIFGNCDRLIVNPTAANP